MLHRMTRVSGPVAALTLVFALAGCQCSGGNGNPSASSAATGDATQEINALLDQYTEALIKKDLAALDRIWADDLTFVNPRGELLNKQNRMDNLKSGSTAFKSIQESEEHIRTYGQTVVANFKVALEAQYSGQDSSGNYRVITVWARPKGTWQMVAVHMTRIAQ